MKSTISASKSQKNASETNPFDSITVLEKAEAARVDSELKGMEREKLDCIRSAGVLEEQAEQNAREEAKAELRKFCENGMQERLQERLKSGEAACQELEQQWKKRAPKLIAELVKQATEHSSHLLS